MKSILVINTPKSCGKCPLCYKEVDSYFSYRCIVDESQVDFKTLNEFCPLKPMPEKNTWDITKNGHVTEYAEGWNACVEEIMEEETEWKQY